MPKTKIVTAERLRSTELQVAGCQSRPAERKKMTQGQSLPGETELQWLGFGFGRHPCALTPRSNAWTALRCALAHKTSPDSKLVTVFLYCCPSVAHLPVTCKTCLLTRSRRPPRFCDFLRLAAHDPSRKSQTVKKCWERLKTLTPPILGMQQKT
jgi:hypothetical protein